MPHIIGIADSVESDASSGEIYNRVAVYQSQFGPVKVVANKHMPAEQIYILDMTSWGLAFGGGKMIHTTDIATQTDETATHHNIPRLADRPALLRIDLFCLEQE